MEAVKELWKDIEGYEGLYKVSSYGNVLSLKYCGSNRKHLLAPNPDHKGYLMVYLSKKGKTKTFKIHRLVASAFIPNPHNLPQVNHIDENPNNNKVENLEWCTRKYNLDYGTRVQRMKEKLATPVLQFDLNGNFIKEHESQSDAARAISGTQTSISCCVRGIYDSYKGYKWRYKYE